jgi:hypothetical protein
VGAARARTCATLSASGRISRSWADACTSSRTSAGARPSSRCSISDRDGSERACRLGILRRAARLPGKQGVDEDQTMPVGPVDLGEQIDAGGWHSRLAARPTPRTTSSPTRSDSTEAWCRSLSCRTWMSTRRPSRPTSMMSGPSWSKHWTEPFHEPVWPATPGPLGAPTAQRPGHGCSPKARPYLAFG